jgi:hypothetical protein
VKGTIEDAHFSVCIGALAVGAVGGYDRVHFFQILWVERPPAEAPSSELNTHFSPPLAAFEHFIDFPHIRFVIHDAVFHLNPGMRSKRHLLCPQDQLCRQSVFPEQGSGGRRSLEAQDLFPIPDAGEIDGITDPSCTR